MANGLNTACLNALHETMNWIAFHSIYVNSPSLRKQPKAQYYQIIVRNFIPEITDSRAVKEFALINLNAGYVQITKHTDPESKYKNLLITEVTIEFHLSQLWGSWIHPTWKRYISKQTA